VKLFVLVVAGCLSFSSAAWAVSWQRPVRGQVLRSFGVAADHYARGQHRGVDLGASAGTEVRAACAGRVRFAGRVPGGGRTVSVACGALVATYQHLAHVAVARGEVVVAGARVGTAGRSGLAPGEPAHVHLGAREASSGRYVDPMALFGPNPVTIPAVPPGPRRRPPLGPSPRASPRPATPRVRALPVAAEPRPAPAPRVPLVAWIGLGAFGLGLPLGGLVTRRRWRRAREGAGLGAQVA